MNTLNQNPEQVARDKTILPRPITAADREIDHMVYALHGLATEEIKIMEDHFKE